jgi:hypothetical protein
MHEYIDRSVDCAFQSVTCVLMDGRYYNALNLLSVFQAHNYELVNIQALRSSLICIQEFISEDRCITFNLFIEFFQKRCNPS